MAQGIPKPSSSRPPETRPDLVHRVQGRRQAKMRTMLLMAADDAAAAADDHDDDGRSEGVTTAASQAGMPVSGSANTRCICR